MRAKRKPWAPTEVERRQFRELAEPIAYLRRACLLTVAPFHGDFRLGDSPHVEVLDADGIVARAKKEREARR